MKDAEIWMQISSVLKDGRIEAKMTQEELAEHVNITARFLQAVEADHRGISVPTLFRWI